MADADPTSGFQELSLDQLSRPEGIKTLNDMLKKLFNNLSGDGETVKVYSNFGSPESAIVAGVGSIYLRRDGGAATSLYVKESGTGATGWVAK